VSASISNILRLTAPFLVASLLGGCSSSPLARYPEFPGKKLQSTSALVISDVIVIEALDGDTAKVDLPENVRLAKLCVNMLAGALNDKGYHVDRTRVTSIGLAMHQDRLFRTARTVEDEQQESALLPVAAPPFLIDRLFSDDTLLQQQLQAAYRRLLLTERRKGEPTITIPEAAAVGKRMGGGLVFVLLAGGFNIPVTGQIGRETRNQSRAEEQIAIQKITQLSASLFVLDGETGEVLWDSRSVKRGGVVHPEKFVAMLQDLLLELP
jgi:hypothetical protein